jgi:potassium uptake TrkH family protein
MVAKASRIRKTQLTSVQLIVLFYLAAISLSTLLVSLPFLHREGVTLSLIDAMFTAMSAISVTGISVISITDTFNTAGYFVLAFILQFGGIGIMALGTFIWLLIGKRIGLKERQLIMADQNQSTLQGLVHLMKQILGLILIIELIGAVILGVYFLRYFPTWQEAFIQGVFASVSATTNAGFDITGASLVPFANDYFVQFVNMILIILGAIGFPVLIETKEFLTHKGVRYSFSLFTKLTVTTFFALVIFGTIIILVLEWNHFFEDKSWHASFFYALFQSVTTRSAGLATMDVNHFSDTTLLVLSALMFIGASPSSVGGGIRTTTFVLVILAVYNFAKGKQTIKVFRREIVQEDIMKSFVVLAMAILLYGTAIILLSISEPFSLLQIIFETASAFGTTGLSMGITPDLSTFGKIVIMFLMFVGRIGILSFIFIIRGKQITDSFHYPKERVIIG